MSGTQTTQSCGAACWYAKEPDCRCSCGGANHGLLLTQDGGEMPRRNCTIQGARYVLGAMGFYSDVMAKLRAFNNQTRETLGRQVAVLENGEPTARWYPAESNRPGAPLWRKQATDSQERWPEVAAWMEQHAQVRLGLRVLRTPEMLWVRENVIDLFDGLEG